VWTAIQSEYEAAAWPLVAPAQQRAMPVIGYLSSAREDGIEALTARFREGLGEQGYVEHRNIEILYRWAETEYDKLPAPATDLVRRAALSLPNDNSVRSSDGAGFPLRAPHESIVLWTIVLEGFAYAGKQVSDVRIREAEPEKQNLLRHQLAR
jgi:hypothetical protein